MIDVAAAIIEKEGKFLITRRKAGQHLAGHWEFPGGKRKSGETWKCCLARELREELGVTVCVGQREQLVEHHYPAAPARCGGARASPKGVRIAFYRCQIVEGRPHPREGQPVRWASRAQLRRLKFPAADGELIRRLASG